MVQTEWQTKAEEVSNPERFPDDSPAVIRGEEPLRVRTGILAG